MNNINNNFDIGDVIVDVIKLVEDIIDIMNQQEVFVMLILANPPPTFIPLATCPF